ncbi:MAG: L,D-transpeptidase family protein, partial [Coriobacteriaceae bacterium]|jgi:uncharacterized protein YjdB|nr:L,D-transpeptidase family protein [Coriobacteriaceae bacterium]
MEAMRLEVASPLASGGVEYAVHAANIGWMAWEADGAMAGTTGQARQLEAVRMRLTGDLASAFDLYYRAHIAGYGWLGWAANGADAGSSRCGIRMEAVEVRLVPKGAPAPGSTSRAYFETPVHLQAMDGRAFGISSPTGWLLLIDNVNCVVGVYYGSQGNWQNYAYWLCSPGTWATPTVRGYFRVGSRGYSFGSGFTCYYWTQFYGDYLFHSVLYYPGTYNFMEGTMGVAGSHGCVRLDLANAKWIYDTIPSGTTVYSY